MKASYCGGRVGSFMLSTCRVVVSKIAYVQRIAEVHWKRKSAREQGVAKTLSTNASLQRG